VLIDIATTDGHHYSRKVDGIKGSPERPINKGEREEKFRNCFRFSGKPFLNSKIDEIIEKVHNFEMLDDIGKFTELLTAS